MTWENRLIFEVSSADPDSPTPVWVDLTSRIRDQIQPVTAQSGRQNDLDQAEPGRFDLLLENSDDALTYGNTLSPYPWWGPGRKCRLRETVAGVVMDRFTGYLQMSTENLVTAGIEQRVSITAVDRLGRLASGEPFVSTLTEYIRSSYPGTLTRYWALSGNAIQYGSTTYVDAIAGKTLYAQRRDALATFTPSDGPVAPADDLRCPRFTPSPVTGAGGPSLLSVDLSAPLAAGQVLTVVAWILPEAADYATTGNLINVLLNESPTAFSTLTLRLASNTFSAENAFGALTGTITTSIAPPLDVAMPIAIRYGYSPSVFEAWIGRQTVTGVLAGSPPTTSSVSELTIGNQRYAGRFAHVQVHIGAATSFGPTEFATQQQMGLAGLERQTTGDRIRTIAQYAGVPAAELTQIDTGSSAMQRATLAGKDPLTAMRDAARTEQGLLYVDGSGSLVFKDRRTLYNI